LFLETGLPKDKLSKIWTLSDIDGDRFLDVEEFIIAQFLINACLKGINLPSSLPSSLIPEKLVYYFINEEKKEEIQRDFSKVDRDKDGLISDSESAVLFMPAKSAGLSSKQLSKIWELSDLTKDRCLSLDEYTIAQVLVSMTLEGQELPSSLPEGLQNLAIQIRKEQLKKKMGISITKLNDEADDSSDDDSEETEYTPPTQFPCTLQIQFICNISSSKFIALLQSFSKLVSISAQLKIFNSENSIFFIQTYFANQKDYENYVEDTSSIMKKLDDSSKSKTIFNMTSLSFQ